MDDRDLARGRDRVAHMEDEAQRNLAAVLHIEVEDALERIHRYTQTEHQLAADGMIEPEHVAMVRYRRSREAMLAAEARAKIEAARQAILRPCRAAGEALGEIGRAWGDVLRALIDGFSGRR